MPIVSVILNTFNSKLYIKEAIDSVLSQSFTDFELIIWDNLSTDETKDIINSYKDDHAAIFSRINIQA